ncbi:dehydrogenase [Rhodotorula diobovata]|uniref:Dehydrogenase n=1 Tax=Rhodotorula diobovata TaxID=5288 RepID=A0A5C5FZC7_9BASI|nr:dehydrogenase [Rhodotorula diobovata]
MSTFTYLITGASRSLGLGYTRALLAARPEARVVAAARNPSSAPDLQALAKEDANKDRVYLLQLDVEDKEQVAKAAKELEASGFLQNGLDALIHNAGVALNHQVKPSQLEPEHVLDNLNVNVFGVLNVNKAFLPLLGKGKGKQVFSLSSVCASLEQWGNNVMTPAYSVSKAALNMWMSKLAAELGPKGYTVIMFHPGYVQTDMNQSKGDITTEEAADLAVKNVFLAAKPELNGAFLRYSGEKMPW